MVSYYHSTTKQRKEKILKNQSVKFSDFDVNKYLNWLLKTVSVRDKLEDISVVYPGAKRSAPYMGKGLYCFEKYEEAKDYQSESTYDVVTINMVEGFSKYDFDDPQVKLELRNLLNNQLQYFVDTRDDEDRQTWQAIIELLKESLYTNFEIVPEMIGVMIHILKEISPKTVYDVYFKTFYVNIKSKDMRHVLIKNKKAILDMS